MLSFSVTGGVATILYLMDYLLHPRLLLARRKYLYYKQVIFGVS